MDKAAKGYDVAKAWLKDSFNIEVVEDAQSLALNDTADIESDVAPIEESSKFVGRKKAFSVTNALSVESLPIVRHNLSLINYVCLTDFNSQNPLAFNLRITVRLQEQSPAVEYKNKKMPAVLRDFCRSR